MTAPFFVCSGGDLIAGHTRLSAEDAAALRALYRDELAAASQAFDTQAAARTRRLAAELQAALTDCARWRAASGALPRR